MLKIFDTFENLKIEVEKDLTIKGSGAGIANRYPVRFVLFDNFTDCCDFVDYILHLTACKIVRMEDWFSDDSMLPPHIIVNNVKTEIKRTPISHKVLMPFSEVTRFLPDEKFEALIDTIIGFENVINDSVQRVYIPIVGLDMKMSSFSKTIEAFIWHFKNINVCQPYKLIITRNDVLENIKMDSNYHIVKTFDNWIRCWNYPNLKDNIITSSLTIYNNAEKVGDDNAFRVIRCENSYDFIKKALELNIDFIPFKKEDSEHWNSFLRLIDINNFEFEKFFNEKFGIFDLKSYDIFFETWFKHKQPFMRWLLAKYYVYKFCNQGYICRVLQNLDVYTDTAFTKGLAITIFSLENKELYIDERSVGMVQCAKNNVELAPEIRTYLVEKVREIEEKEGIISALKYVSAYTYEEKALIIEWYSNGKVSNEQLRELYPDLYYYLGKTIASAEDPWVLDYIDKYKDAKVKNEYTDAVDAYIQDRNKDYLQHFKWTNKFRTTRTIMNARTDIQCYYWIDGLGLDWIPFIEQIVKEKELEGYYLNEVYVATAKLPTVTDINKKDIDLLSGGLVEKYGDLDHSCHSCRAYPKYIIDDLTEVRKAIVKLLSEHPGEKIAIVSDHGISYLSQLKQGHNLKGYTSEHWGRIALSSKKPSDIVNDEKYTVVETPDGKSALCALKHDSLMAKIPEGMGAHGGCTPEEQLVPIIIISPEKTTVSWSATLKSFEVEEANPIVIYSILGLDNKQIPLLEYDGIVYAMNLEGGVYKSERLKLNKDVTKVTLRIGTWSREDKINIKLAVQEDDLFTF